MSREQANHSTPEELVWPLVEFRHNTTSLMVQSGGKSHRPSRHFAARYLRIANRHGRAEEQLWGVSLNLCAVVAEGEGEGADNQPIDVASRIVVHTRLSKIRKELQQQQRRVDCMLELRRVKRAAVGRDGSMTLKECDQKVVAVVVAIQGEPRVLRGSASFVADLTLGNCLCIKIDDPASSGVEILLRESEWSGKITPDTKYGCDAVVYLDENHCPS